VQALAALVVLDGSGTVLHLLRPGCPLRLAAVAAALATAVPARGLPVFIAACPARRRNAGRCLFVQA